MLDTVRSHRRPLVFGIMNMTPDSFSDGGDLASTDAALRHCDRLFSEGADIVDVGAESTRPGAKPVSLEDEWQRLEPLMNALCKRGLTTRISVDTRKPEIMARAAEAGCRWINCVGPLPSEDALAQLKRSNPHVGYVATHMHGEPESMQAHPLAAKRAIQRVEEFFSSSLHELQGFGFTSEEILLDPGIGFGKTPEANLLLVARCAIWSRNYALAVGVSRKSMFGNMLDIDHPKDRDAASKVAEMGLAMAGVRMIRTHAVAPLARCLDLWEAALS